MLTNTREHWITISPTAFSCDWQSTKEHFHGQDCLTGGRYSQEAKDGSEHWRLHVLVLACMQWSSHMPPEWEPTSGLGQRPELTLHSFP
jgi:hypothetical protein